MNFSPDNNIHDPWKYDTPPNSTGIHYLGQAMRSIDNSRENIINGLENLEAQTNTIHNIHRNMGVLNAKLDMSEYKLKQIKNTLVTHQHIHTDQSNLITYEFFMRGNIKKYTKTFKHWYTSGYTLDKTTFKYQRLIKSKDIIINLEDCTFKYICRGDKLYDNSICKYDNVLEIKQVMYSDGIVQYHAFRTVQISEMHAFVNYLKYYAGYTIEGIDNKTVSRNEEDIILDMFNTKLDELHVLSSNIGVITDEHTKNIQIISDNMEKSDKRILKCANKTKYLQ